MNGRQVTTVTQTDEPAQPYRSTPVFDETSLPPGLRAEHRLKAGVWGRIRVLEGRLKLNYIDPPSEVMLTPEAAGRIAPEQPHFVTPQGAIKMRVDFYDVDPGEV